MIRFLVLTLLTVAIYYLVDGQVRRWRQRFDDRLRRHLANDPKAKTVSGATVRTGGALVACDRCGLFVAEARVVRRAGDRGRYCSETCAGLASEG